MNAFDELCRMLDERGARYFRQEREGKRTLARVSWVYPTGPDSSDVFIATIVRYGDHLRFRGYLTPEQAIAATLGPGTCRLIDTQFPTGDDSYFKACSGCGFWIYNRYSWENTRFCPHCGRKVVDA